MRPAPILACLALFSATAHAANDPEAAQDPAQSSVQVTGETGRACIPGTAIVPPFNNTPEALDQSRVAARQIAGDSVCRTSAVAPELSELEHGPEFASDPGEGDAPAPVAEPA